MQLQDVVINHISKEKQSKINEFNQGIQGLRAKYFGQRSKATNSMDYSTRNLIQTISKLKKEAESFKEDERIESYQTVLRSQF